MFYKKFSVFCFAALLAMQTAVCSATVPQDADNDAKPKVLNQKVLKQAEKKAQKQAKQAAKKAKKQKNSYNHGKNGSNLLCEYRRRTSRSFIGNVKYTL